MPSAMGLAVKYRGVFMTAILGITMTVPCWGTPRYGPRQTVTLQSGGYPTYFTTGSPEEILLTGGNPDAYDHTIIVSAEPRLTSTPLHPFYHLWLGNYTYSQIINVGVDVNLFNTGIAADSRPLTLSLRNNAQTPDDPSDDCEVVRIGGKHVQKPGRGWKSYDFNVPYSSLVLPNSWVVAEGTCKDLTANEAWLRVIHDVNVVSFVFGEPGASYDIQSWEIGFDNTRLTIDRDGVLPFAGPPSVDFDVP